MKIIGPSEFSPDDDKDREESQDAKPFLADQKEESSDLLRSLLEVVLKGSNVESMKPKEFANHVFQTNAAELFKAQLSKSEGISEKERAIWLSSIFPATVGCMAGVVGFVRSSKDKDFIVEDAKELMLAYKEDNEHPDKVPSMHEILGACFIRWCTCSEEELPEDLQCIMNGVKQVFQAIEK